MLGMREKMLDMTMIKNKLDEDKATDPHQLSL